METKKTDWASAPAAMRRVREVHDAIVADAKEREYERKCREDKFLEYAEMVAFAADVIRENRDLRAKLQYAQHRINDLESE